MWFGQKLFKNAKITTKIMKIWLFCEIQSGNAQNRPFPVFWHFLTIFGQKLFKNAKKPEMADFGRYQIGFHKIAKSSLFQWQFWHFEKFLAKPHQQLTKTGQSDPLAKTCLPATMYVCLKTCESIFSDKTLLQNGPTPFS